MQKGFVQFIVLGIVGLIIVAAGAFYLGKQVATPKPQPQTSQITPSTSTSSPAPTGAGETSNWKTYSPGGFSFKYPTHWDLQNCGPSTIIYLDNETVSCQGGHTDITVIIGSSSDNEFSSYKSTGTVVKERKISLGGKDATQMDFVSKDDKLPFTVTQIINNDMNGDVVYYFIFSTKGSTEDVSNRKTYDLLLSTMKYWGAD